MQNPSNLQQYEAAKKAELQNRLANSLSGVADQREMQFLSDPRVQQAYEMQNQVVHPEAVPALLEGLVRGVAPWAGGALGGVIGSVPGAIIGSAGSSALINALYGKMHAEEAAKAQEAINYVRDTYYGGEGRLDSGSAGDAAYQQATGGNAGILGSAALDAIPFGGRILGAAQHLIGAMKPTSQIAANVALDAGQAAGMQALSGQFNTDPIHAQGLESITTRPAEAGEIAGSGLIGAGFSGAGQALSHFINKFRPPEVNTSEINTAPASESVLGKPSTQTEVEPAPQATPEGASQADTSPAPPPVLHLVKQPSNQDIQHSDTPPEQRPVLQLVKQPTPQADIPPAPEPVQAAYTPVSDTPPSLASSLGEATSAETRPPMGVIGQFLEAIKSKNTPKPPDEVRQMEDGSAVAFTDAAPTTTVDDAGQTVYQGGVSASPVETDWERQLRMREEFKQQQQEEFKSRQALSNTSLDLGEVEKWLKVRELDPLKRLEMTQKRQAALLPEAGLATTQDINEANSAFTQDINEANSALSEASTQAKEIEVLNAMLDSHRGKNPLPTAPTPTPSYTQHNMSNVIDGLLDIMRNSQPGSPDYNYAYNKIQELSGVRRNN
jgi:hypothetical protein